jgi:shikimate kinase
VVFVGMMGTGKSTVGRRVARRLGLPFVDADEALEKVTGRSIPEWFAAGDEAGFRDAEEGVLDTLLAADEPTVIATGGGAVVREANRARLRQSPATVVWLRASPAFLAHRIDQKPDRAGRPLLADDPKATLERIEQERHDKYAEVADMVIDIEPVHRGGDRPKKRLATIVLDALGVEDPSQQARTS